MAVGIVARHQTCLPQGTGLPSRAYRFWSWGTTPSPIFSFSGELSHGGLYTHTDMQGLVDHVLVLLRLRLQL